MNHSLSMLLGTLVALLLGCSSFENRMAPVNDAWAAGDYEQAARLLEQLEVEDSSNAHLHALNRGMSDLARQEPERALEHFRRGRNRFDELVGNDWKSWLGAMLTDDTALTYAGEDYEHILLRVMLALADLICGKGDAEAFALQVREKQLEIMEAFEDNEGVKPKQAYRLVAFGSYLVGIMNEQDPLALDAARMGFERVKELAPDYPQAAADLERVTSGHYAARGNGVVHVLALVGRGPFKVERDQRAARYALAIAQVIWNLYRDRITFPNVTHIKIPELAHHQDNPTEAWVEVDGRRAGATATITDVDDTAQQQFEIMRPWIEARAVLRRAFKIVAAELAKEHAGKKGSDTQQLASLGIDVLGMLWTAAERADTRCWSLLPARFQALRVELPAGDHELTIHAGRNGRRVGPAQTVRVRVRDGFNTYVVALVPTLDGGPPPLTSEPAADGP